LISSGRLREFLSINLSPWRQRCGAIRKTYMERCRSSRKTWPSSGAPVLGSNLSRGVNRTVAFDDPLPRVERKCIGGLDQLARLGVCQRNKLRCPLADDRLGVAIPGESADGDHCHLFLFSISHEDDRLAGGGVLEASFHGDGADVLRDGANNRDSGAD